MRNKINCDTTMKNISIIIEALHNYGYRCLGNQDNNIIFAKPMSYSFVKAEIVQNKSNFKLEMLLIVKGTDGSNMVWTSKKNTLENIRPDEKYYLNVVQIIMDFEASILGGKFAWEVNRNKRFDFIENAKCLNEID